MKSNQPIEALLRSAKLKVTPGRVALIQALHAEKLPLSVATIQKKLAHELDGVTVYRTLETLADAGIVNRVDLGHGHAHYELAADRPHHHHVVCTACGEVEDIASCAALESQPAILGHSKKFKSITSHSMEFFGVCKKCT